MSSAHIRTTQSAPQFAAVRVDDRGRITIPKKIRETLDIQEGDTCFIDFEENSFRIVRGENPFTVLARDAMKQYERGETVSFEEALESFEEAMDELDPSELVLPRSDFELLLQKFLLEVEGMHEATKRLVSDVEQYRTQYG